MTIKQATAASFNITPLIGVDVTNAFPVYAIPGSTATQTNLYYPETNNPPFAIGTHVLGGGNTEYVLCVVGTAGSINQYDVVAIDKDYNVTQMATTASCLSAMVGFNQNAGIAGSNASVTVNFCWIALRGDTLTVNTNTATNINAILFVGTAPGTLTSASASTYILHGVVNQASVTAATTMAVIAGYPVLNIDGR